MECGQVREKLSCYLDGALDEAALEAVEAHLKICAACREELWALRSAIGLASELSDVEPPPGLSSAIRDAIAKERKRVGSCASVLSILSEYVDGELLESDVSLVEAHVAECDRCANELRMLRATVGSLRMVAEVEPPAGLRERIAAATTARRPFSLAMLWSRLGLLRRRPQLGWSVGAAAAAAAIAGLWLAMPHGTPRKPQVIAREPSPPAISEAPRRAQVVKVPTPPEKPSVYVLHRATRRTILTRAQSKPTSSTAAAPTEPKVAFVEKTAERREAAEPPAPGTAGSEEGAAVEGGHETAAREKDLTAEKPAAPAAAEPSASAQPSIIKIARASAPAMSSTSDMASFFKDFKKAAEMKRRSDDRIKVDVISARF